jgi:hypothetical protein
MLTTSAHFATIRGTRVVEIRTTSYLERYQCMWNAGDDIDEEVTSQRLAKLRVMRREAVAR